MTRIFSDRRTHRNTCSVTSVTVNNTIITEGWIWFFEVIMCIIAWDIWRVAPYCVRGHKTFPQGIHLQIANWLRLATVNDKLQQQ